MGTALMEKDALITQLRGGQKGQLKKQIAELKAENEKLIEASDTLTDLGAELVEKNAELKAENEKMDVVKWANQYAELQAEHEKLKEQVGIIIAEELRSVQEENEWIQNEKAELIRKVQEYDPSFVYCNCHSSEEEAE